MKSVIVYIHGMGSSSQGDTAKNIKKSFPKEQVVCPNIDHMSDPDKIRSQMDILGIALKHHSDAIVVGSSAGGFWADYIGSVYGIKTVLVNPSLKPSVNYKKYNLPKEYYDKYSNIQSFIRSHARHHMVAFVGDKDDVVPIEHVTSHYKTPHVLKGEGHRLKNLSPVVKMISSMVGNIPEYL
jgi:predicted esterase YcpF (UPF0227 family)